MNASAGHTWNSQDALGTKLNSVKKEAIWRHYPKRWISWAKSLRAWFWGTTTWGNLTTSRLYQQSSVEFGEKIRKLKPNISPFYSLVKAPETQKIVCLLCIRKLQCKMLSKEIWAQMQWILWEGPKHHKRFTATGCSANKRVSTSFCSWSRSLLDETPAILLLYKLYWKRGYSCDQVFSLYQDCHHIPAAFCLQHRDQRISPIISENWEH